MNTEFIDVSVYDLSDNLKGVHRWRPMNNKADKIREYMLRKWCHYQDRYDINTRSYSYKLLVYHKKLNSESDIYEKYIPVGDTHRIMFEASDFEVERTYDRRHSRNGVLY